MLALYTNNNKILITIIPVGLTLVQLVLGLMGRNGRFLGIIKFSESI